MKIVSWMIGHRIYARVLPEGKVEWFIATLPSNAHDVETVPYRPDSWYGRYPIGLPGN